MNPIETYFELKKEAQETDPGRLLCTYLAYLRALYNIHQQSHWLCQSHGAHLMFDRIYNEKQTMVDEMAEKIIGVFGKEPIDLKHQASVIQQIMDKYSGEDHFENSLEAEKGFQELSNKVYGVLKKSGDITMGLDDMIMAQFSMSEEAVYLIKQAKY